MMNLINRVIAAIGNPVQRYVDTPVTGRLAPQPNMDLDATHIVKWLLRLR